MTKILTSSMINRSTLKYRLKKILPKPLFAIVLAVWQKALLALVEGIDVLRLKKFTSYREVTLSHRKSTFSLFISPRNGFIDNYIFLYGVYESFMLDLITTYLEPGMTFVDIGANIGQHSMYAATLVGEKGAVYSYEPIPYIYKQLQDSVHANHFEKIVHAKNVAIGEKDSEETLHVSRKNIGGSSLVNSDGTTERITVHVKNGTTELQALLHIHMIKIDVEGYEYEVLHSITPSLKKHSPVILLEFSGEFYTKQQKQHGKKIMSILRECNYSIFDIENDMEQIRDDTHFVHLFTTTRKQTNLLCVIKK